MKAVELSSVGLGVGRGIAVDQVVEGIARQSEMEGQIPEITKGMKKLGDELLEKCGGLPLAVMCLVDFWRTTSGRRFIETSICI